MNRFVLPLAVFAALIALLAVGLAINPREVPSPVIGKPARHFELPQLHQAAKTFTEKDMLGRVWMLNVWASWCVPCREEHPVLLDLAKSGSVPLYGLNYKDKREDGLAWLKAMGGPYQLSIFDVEGRAGIDYGVYGVPDTNILDKLGVTPCTHPPPLPPQTLN